MANEVVPPPQEITPFECAQHNKASILGAMERSKKSSGK